MTDLWVEASTDLDAEGWAQRMAFAKVSAASLWPFLASAQSEQDFEHRLALSFEHLANRVEPELVDSVVASLRDDYATLTAPVMVPTAPPQRSQAVPRTASQTLPQYTATLISTPAPLMPMQVFHVASQRWVTVQAAAEQSPENPLYGQNIPEHGPETGETNTFPQHPTGSDPMDPINGPDPSNVIPPAESFPAQPQPWNAGPGWVENPMSFNPPRSAAVHQAQQPVQQMQTGPLDYTDEGVETGTGQNPFYFDQGDQGITGQGFPEDVALPEPDERVDMYNNAMPNAQMMGYEQGYVTALLHAVSKEAEYHYIHEQSPGDWVVTQKGSGKVLSHHDSEEQAQESFKAMMMNKHSSRVAAAYGHPQYVTRTADAGSDNGNYLAGNPYMDAGDQPTPVPTVQPPDSTQQGGAGAEAMPPMGAGGGGGGGNGPMDPSGSDMAAKTSKAAIWHTAEDEYRSRPSNQYAPEEGVADEYDARTWGNATKANPRQPAQDRGVNTPQRPNEPIPQNSSSGDRPAQSDEDMDDEDERREASRRVVSNQSARNGHNRPNSLTWGSSSTFPRGERLPPGLSSIVNQSVSRAMAQAGRRG